MSLFWLALPLRFSGGLLVMVLRDSSLSLLLFGVLGVVAVSFFLSW